MGITPGHVAYQGIVKLEKATWDTTWGMYASFLLDQPPQLKEHSNPFKKFTGMRKGRVGTIFESVFNSCDDTGVHYAGEVMLKGWSDGTTGWKVTFWFNTEAVGHPFLDVDKDTEFALVLVEVDDDSAPINQEKRERLKTKRPNKLSNFAAQLCRTPEFWMWLQDEHGVQTAGDEYPLSNVEDISADWMRTVLDMGSRSELDTNSIKAADFHERIRMPYSRWYKQNVD
jgi:hypothetical protein